MSYKRSRIRRAPSDIDKPVICPYAGCTKAYSTKTSLRLHVKRNHNEGDPLKETVNSECGGTIMNSPRFKRGINLENVFKKDYLPKIQSKLGIEYYNKSCSNYCDVDSVENESVNKNSKVDKQEKLRRELERYLDNEKNGLLNKRL